MPTLNSSSPQTEGIKEIRTTQDPLLRRRFLGGMLFSGIGMVAGCSEFAFGKDELDELVATANRCSDDVGECLETMLADNQHEHETVSPTKPKQKFRFLKGEL